MKIRNDESGARPDDDKDSKSADNTEKPEICKTGPEQMKHRRWDS